MFHNISKITIFVVTNYQYKEFIYFDYQRTKRNHRAH